MSAPAPAHLIDKAAAELVAIDPSPTPTSMGDWSAKRAGIRHAEHSQPPPNVDPTTGEVLTNNLPSSFWEARPELAMIRQAAHARTCSADAVFGATLARLSALTPPTIKGPAPMGGPCSLNVIVALIGRSGTGKTMSAEVAEQLLPASAVDDVLTVALGSGEGLVEAYMGTVDDEDESGKRRKVRRQVRNRVLFMVDEGQALSEMGGRKGSTLLPTLRTAWTGSRMGQANASEERTRQLPSHEYRMASLAGFQLETAVAIIDDAAGGTPQRLVWFSAEDPTIPDAEPEWPGSIDYSHPRQAGPMPLAESARAEVRATHLAKNRGLLVVDPLDGHRNLSRLKVSALLALLAGRCAIIDDDWCLSGVVLDTSDRVRAGILAAARNRAAEAERSATARVVGRAVAVATSEETRALNAWSFAIGRHVAKEACDGGCKRRCLTRAVPGKYRDHVTIDAAIEAATEAGWIIVDGDTYRPGSSRPAPSGGRS